MGTEATINDTLVELRNQNVLIRQANIDARAAEKERTAAEQVSREKREWVTEEAQKIERCEGLPASSMRAWLRAMKGAMERTPKVNPAVANAAVVQAQVDRELGRKLMARAARGPLTVEIDKIMTANPETGVTDVLGDVEEVFLGADEAAARRSELEELRQQGGTKPEHQIPAYCRLFLQKADEAYGIINRAEETEAKLAELFVTSLHSEDIAREVFEHDPPLVTLGAVQQRTTEIHNRSRRMGRAWKGRRRVVQGNVRRETPMEIGPLESKHERALLERIERLEKELSAVKSGAGSREAPRPQAKPTPKASSSTYDGPRVAGPKTACYECGRLGHFGRDCEQRAQRCAREAAEATAGQE